MPPTSNIHASTTTPHVLGSNKAKHPQFEYESKVYKTLAGGVGIPFVQWLGTECGYNAMVLDLLGPLLEDLFGFCNCKFSLKTVLLLADQLLPRQGLKAATKEQKHGRIMEKKTATPTDLLCRGFPNKFSTSLNHCHALRFDDQPNYSRLCKLFRVVRERYPDNKCSNPNNKPRRKVIGDEEGASQFLIPDSSRPRLVVSKRDTPRILHLVCLSHSQQPSISIATALEEDLKSFTKLRRFNMFDEEESLMNVNFSSYYVAPPTSAVLYSSGDAMYFATI
ncbi:unnamed protein product [Rhizoctonia solani]|uniref:Uncharacterized protein n=1 Tax=Rhizoctonia solani TaxID=456999 RepID=A0A8H3HYE3_9AGAM|nr:unnamed protein product [Rhizoctonia solani]